MKAYDNPSAITIEEFNSDLFMIMSIRKFIRKYLVSPEEVNVRKLVNYFVVVYNCFGKTATDLIYYKLNSEELLSVAIPIIVFLGWDVNHIPEPPINSSIVQELLQL